MGTLGRVAVAVLLTLVVAAPAGATMVRIETAAALADQSDKSLDAALKQAVEKSIRGAAAMGLSVFWLDQAFVFQGRVVVRMLATDEDLEDQDDTGIGESAPGVIVPQPGSLPRGLRPSSGL
jgi:hypothetical protein